MADIYLKLQIQSKQEGSVMKNANTNAKKKYIKLMLIFIFFIIFVLINIGVKRQAGDDIAHLQELKQAGSIFNLLKSRYLTWTGRVFLEFLMYSFLDSNIIIWKIINSFMILLLGLGIYKFVSISDNSDHKYDNCLVVTAMMSTFMLPLGVYSSSITWITGSFNYLWPVALGMVVLIFIKKCLYNKKISHVEFILTIFCSFFACNQEQVSAILLGFNLFIIIFYYIKYRQLNYKLLILFCFIILFSSFCILAPGNSSRYFCEIKTWYPEFGNLSLTYKALQSISYSLNNFVTIFTKYNSQINLLMLSISGMIFALCKSKVLKTVSFLPMVYFVIRVLFNPSFGYFIFDNNLNHIQTVNGVLSLFLAIIVFAIMLTCLYFCFDNIERKCISLVLFLGAILSSFVVGFSPTIFASGARIFFCSFILFIIIFNMLFFETIIKFKDNVWFIVSWLFYFVYLSLIILSYVVAWSGQFIA